MKAPREKTNDEKMRISVKLANDPRVLEVEYPPESGSDYHYFVTLKEGFMFAGYGSRSKGFNSVARCQRLIKADDGKLF